MSIGGGAGGDSWYDASSGTHRGPGAPGAGVPSEVGQRIDRATTDARLWMALALLAVIVILGLIVLF